MAMGILRCITCCHGFPCFRIFSFAFVPQTLGQVVGTYLQPCPPEPNLAHVEAPEQPGRRKKHKTVWSIWLSTSPTSAVKHILLQPRWRTLMYCKFVNVCSAGCSLVFPAVEEILTYCDCRFQCDPGNSVHLRHSRH
jgi:hypothetical protein